MEKHSGNLVVTSRDLDGSVIAAIKSGHRVYAYGDIWSDPDTRARLKDISPEYNPQQVFNGLQRAQGWKNPVDSSEYIWRLIPETAGY
jgi:hypothetical protein